MYSKCYNQKFDKTLRKAAHKLGQRAIAEIIKELDTCIRDLSELEEADIHPILKQLISEYCEVMMSIKQKIGTERMPAMTKGLDFVPVIYGGPGSKMTIVVLYVCQSCGWAPKFDYDYYVTKKAWWCARC